MEEEGGIILRSNIMIPGKQYSLCNQCQEHVLKELILNCTCGFRWCAGCVDEWSRTAFFDNPLKVIQQEKTRWLRCPKCPH